MFQTLLSYGLPLAIGLGGFILIAVMFRRVVASNMTHIVQRRRKTVSYGTGKPGGNVYYAWPSWIPLIGVTVIKLPVSNFDLPLNDYDAYDRDRVPFMVDVASFFRIADTDKAAERVSNMDELRQQLTLIVQGAVRTVLASDVIDKIMVERSQFGDKFTDEVSEQLQQWGIETVKAMELMDIRDAKGSKVVQNIMAKKTSQIDMESRVEVAKNERAAREAEIHKEEAINLREQERVQKVGERTAQQEKAVGLAKEQSRQEILSQERETKVRSMAVLEVEKVRAAEIAKAEELVAADKEKQAQVIRAEGLLESKRREASGLEAIGLANATAEKAMQLAPVQAQITLAKEIGENAGYQQYLQAIEAIKAYLAVGSKQAEALQDADIKVIANAGQPAAGLKSAMDLFSSTGGLNLGAMVEAFAQTPLGTAVLAKLGVNTETDAAKS